MVLSLCFLLVQVGGPTGSSSYPVMSSHEKSPPRSSRSQVSHVFRDVFVCRLVTVKRSHLGSCTHDFGTAVGNPNCGQRVADDHAWVPKSVCRFLGCTRFTSPKTRGVVQHAVGRCSVWQRGARLVSSDICGPRLNLRGGQGVS